MTLDPGVGGVWQNGGLAVGTTQGTVITSSSSANTTGTVITLISGADFDCIGIYVNIAQGNAEGISYLVNIIINTGGSDQLLIPNIPINTNTSTFAQTRNPFFPVMIPKGADIKCSLQDSTGSGTMEVTVAVLSASGGVQNGYGSVENFGANTSDSGGQPIDPGGTANTLVYAEFSASLANRIKAVIIFTQTNEADETLTVGQWQYHLAIGAASSEIPIAPVFVLSASGSRDMLAPNVGPLICLDIPAGERLSIGLQSDITTTQSNRTVEFVIFAFS